LVTDETGRDLIPLTVTETRRLFNLHTRVTRPEAFHENWSGWKRQRQASACKSHYSARRPYFRQAVRAVPQFLAKRSRREVCRRI
jgi:hypothetical protein